MICSLSDAHRVILIGHEGGTAALSHLLELRCRVTILMGLVCLLTFIQLAGAVMSYVKGVVQVIGHARNPYVPKISSSGDGTLKNWYFKVR